MRCDADVIAAPCWPYCFSIRISAATAAAWTVFGQSSRRCMPATPACLDIMRARLMLTTHAAAPLYARRVSTSLLLHQCAPYVNISSLLTIGIDMTQITNDSVHNVLCLV